MNFFIFTVSLLGLVAFFGLLVMLLAKFAEKYGSWPNIALAACVLVWLYAAFFWFFSSVYG